MQPTRLLGLTRYEHLDRVERDPSKPADAHGTSAYAERRRRRLGPRCDPSAIAASSQAEAKRLLREALTRVASNQPGVDHAIPLSDYARRWIETYLAVRDVKDSTLLV
jgi:hypothetical protein